MARYASNSYIHAAAHHPATQQSDPERGRGADSRTPSIDADERLRMIRDVAYSLYERRGFAHGRDVDDWLVAEAYVDRMISRQQKPESIESVEMPEPDLHQSSGRSIVRDEMMKRILKQHPLRDVPKV